MSVAKTIEITASSAKSFKSAIKHGIERASETIEGISGAWVSEEKVIVEDGAVTEYRVTLRITFLLSDEG